VTGEAEKERYAIDKELFEGGGRLLLMVLEYCYSRKSFLQKSSESSPLHKAAAHFIAKYNASSSKEIEEVKRLLLPIAYEKNAYKAFLGGCEFLCTCLSIIESTNLCCSARASLR
jgi:hypothetical protein